MLCVLFSSHRLSFYAGDREGPEMIDTHTHTRGEDEPSKGKNDFGAHNKAAASRWSVRRGLMTHEIIKHSGGLFLFAAGKGW